MLVGADPEFGIWDTVDQVWVPAWKGGIPSRAARKAGDPFRDGFGVEFNPYPNLCVGLLLNDLQGAVTKVEDRINQHLHATRRYVLRAPGAIAPPISVTLPEGSPGDVLQVGCTPSFSIYSEWACPQIAPWNPLTHEIRMFSGHLHFSMGGIELATALPGTKGIHDRPFVEKAIRALDLTVGVASAYIFQDEPEEFARRAFYGRAGEYRLQTYESGTTGLEYRTPSAAIWRNGPVLALLMALGREALRSPERVLQQAKEELGLEGDALDMKLQAAINTGEGLEEMLTSTYFHGWMGFRVSEGERLAFSGRVVDALKIAKEEWAVEHPGCLMPWSLQTHSALGLTPPCISPQERCSREAIKKLREIRGREFGPEVSILSMPAAKEDHHFAWPEAPRHLWTKEFDGIEV